MSQCMAKIRAKNPKSPIVSFWNCQSKEHDDEGHELPPNAVGDGAWIPKQKPGLLQA